VEGRRECGKNHVGKWYRRNTQRHFLFCARSAVSAVRVVFDSRCWHSNLHAVLLFKQNIRQVPCTGIPNPRSVGGGGRVSGQKMTTSSHSSIQSKQTKDHNCLWKRQREWNSHTQNSEHYFPWVHLLSCFFTAEVNNGIMSQQEAGQAKINAQTGSWLIRSR
jgi:hypothetical protein